MNVEDVVRLELIDTGVGDIDEVVISAQEVSINVDEVVGLELIDTGVGGIDEVVISVVDKVMSCLGAVVLSDVSKV